MKNCQKTFYILLLYSIRSKDETKKNYLIHIDIYEKKTLQYRESTIKSLKFSFLPVHIVLFIKSIFLVLLIISMIVRVVNVSMENVENILMIDIIEHFVNVTKDGLDNHVQYNILQHVHLIHYISEN
jgi:hypothetical protein